MEEPEAEQVLEEKLLFADSVGKTCYLHHDAGLCICVSVEHALILFLLLLINKAALVFN